VSVEIDVAVPPAPMSQRFRRRLAVLVGVAALSAAVLSWVEADAGRKEEQAFVNASRGALDILVRIAASNPRIQFEANAARRGLLIQSEGLARVVGAPRGELFGFVQRRAGADEKSGQRFLTTVEPMVQVPEKVPRLDLATTEALRSDPTKLDPLVREQNDFVDEANKHGTRQERGMFALGLVAIAASLLALAGLMGDGRRGRISLTTATGALLVAILAGASGYVL
jgi:hypothetical protein